MKETRISVWYLFHAVFLLDLFFGHPEDGSEKFLQKDGFLSTDYTALYPGRYTTGDNLETCIIQ
jgi:hypothetical protein